MTTLLEKALQKVEALPEDDQNAIASEILDSLADEEAWKVRFVAKRDRLRHLAQEALQEDERGETRPLDDLL
jgi:predicted RNA-binding protein with EMAP domain